MRKRWIDANGNYTRVPNIVIDDVELSPSARHTYSLLVRSSFWKKLNGDKTETLVSWIGTDRLADAMDCGVRSVTRYTRELEEKGLIDRTRRMGKNSQTIIFDPKTVYGEALRQDTSGVTSGQQCPDVRPPVACRQDSGDASGTEETGTKSEPDKGLQDGPEPNQDVIEQDVIEQDVPEQEPRNDGAALDGGDRTPDETSTGLETNATTSPTKTTATTSQTETNACSPSAPRPYGRLAHPTLKKDYGSKGGSKVGAPVEDLGVDDRDPDTARQVYREFEKAIVEAYSGYNPPAGHPTPRELGNCKTLLSEYSSEDIRGLIDMVVSRWMVIREKWPKLAKTPMPSFYVLFTLRRDLMPLVQTGKGLTSRTHRVDEGAKKAPAIGWGDK